MYLHRRQTHANNQGHPSHTLFCDVVIVCSVLTSRWTGHPGSQQHRTSADANGPPQLHFSRPVKSAVQTLEVLPPEL
eukprot:1092892-Rhodomonas_salina.4